MSLLPNMCMAIVTNFTNKRFGTSWFCHYCQNVTHGVVTIGGHICTHIFSFLFPISPSDTAYQVEIPPCNCLMHSALPADPKNVNEYLSSIQNGTATSQISREVPKRFLDIYKMCQNFMAWLLGVVLHLPWVVIHNSKSTHVGSYHLKGFQDRSMYKEKKVGLGIDTWDETPCSMLI